MYVKKHEDAAVTALKMRQIRLSLLAATATECHRCDKLLTSAESPQSSPRFTLQYSGRILTLEMGRCHIFKINTMSIRYSARQRQRQRAQLFDKTIFVSAMETQTLCCHYWCSVLSFFFFLLISLFHQNVRSLILAGNKRDRLDYIT